MCNVSWYDGIVAQITSDVTTLLYPSIYLFIWFYSSLQETMKSLEIKTLIYEHGSQPIISLLRNVAQSIWYHVSKNQWSEHYGLIDDLRLPFFNRSLWLVLVFPSALPSFCICSQAQFQPGPLCCSRLIDSLIHWFILCYPVKDGKSLSWHRTPIDLTISSPKAGRSNSKRGWIHHSFTFSCCCNPIGWTWQVWVDIRA